MADLSAMLAALKKAKPVASSLSIEAMPMHGAKDSDPSADLDSPEDSTDDVNEAQDAAVGAALKAQDPKLYEQIAATLPASHEGDEDSNDGASAEMGFGG